MLPAQQGSVGTSALLTMLPFGALLVLCCHLFDSAVQVVGLGAFTPRLVLAPLIIYVVYSAWAKLLGAVPNIWNGVLYVPSLSAGPLLLARMRLSYCFRRLTHALYRAGYAGMVLCGWLAAGWFIDVMP